MDSVLKRSPGPWKIQSFFYTSEFMCNSSVSDFVNGGNDRGRPRSGWSQRVRTYLGGAGLSLGDDAHFLLAPPLRTLNAAQWLPQADFVYSGYEARRKAGRSSSRSSAAHRSSTVTAHWPAGAWAASPFSHYQCLYSGYRLGLQARL
nr:unnamed protein product [Callosobruchus chinensis]